MIKKRKEILATKTIAHQWGVRNIYCLEYHEDYSDTSGTVYERMYVFTESIVQPDGETSKWMIKDCKQKKKAIELYNSIIKNAYLNEGDTVEKFDEWNY